MKIAILVFIGGAIGAICRDLLMIFTPELSSKFPLDIFLANIIASFLVGIIGALLVSKKISQASNAFLATGIMGGLSTFSSFVYGAVELTNNTGGIWVSLFYLVSSIIIGFVLVFIGYHLGTKIKMNFSS